MADKALVLKAPSLLARATDIPTRAPMPNWATAYIDFTSGLQMTTADANAAEASTLVVRGPVAGHYYDVSGLALADANGGIRRVEYDADGWPLGLRVSTGFTSFLAPDARQDLTVGAAVGAVVAAVGAASDAWRQWYSVTPEGETEASVSLPTESISVAYVWWGIDVEGAGCVQLGAKTDTTLAYANFDLAKGDAVGSTGVAVAMKRRPDGSTSIFARLPVQSTPNADYQPYVASIAAIDTARLGTPGLPFNARAPRLATAATTNLTPPEYHSSQTTSNRSSDELSFDPALFPAGQPFSAIFSFRSDWYEDRWGQGLFAMGMTSGVLHMRFNEGGVLTLYDGTSTAVHTFATPYDADTIYHVGVSISGAVLAISVNGEEFTYTIANATAPWASFFYARGNSGSTYNWGGWVEKAILKAGEAYSAAKLTALCERWL